MDSRWRDAFQGLADKLIAEDSEQLVTKHSAYFVCGNLILSILDTIEHIEQPRGKGMEHFPVPDDAEQTILPPQRSMTPEESANLAAYHKTIFKRVVAQGDELREEVPIIHGRAELAVHDAALRASVREECADAAMEAGPSHGAEDIDELVCTINGVTLHIEKMDDNEYFIGLDGPKGKSLTLFIGHWPLKKNGEVNHKKSVLLKLNVAENDAGAHWNY